VQTISYNQGVQIRLQEGFNAIPCTPEWDSMMTVRQLVEYVAAEPFRPFRIRMASGETYLIRHPEMIAVGRSTARVSTFWSDEPGPTKQREHELSLLLMESVEPLEVATAKDGKQ
jgi:hypothetical protein